MSEEQLNYLSHQVEEAKASAGDVTEALGSVAVAAKSASETSEESLSAAKEGMTLTL